MFKGKLSNAIFGAVLKILNCSMGNGEEFTNEVGKVVFQRSKCRIDDCSKGTIGYIAPEVFSRNFGNLS